MRPIDKVLPVENGWLLIEHDYEYQTNEGEINISRINNRSEIVWTQKHKVSPIGFDGDIDKTKDGGFVFMAPSGRGRAAFVNMFKFNSSGAMIWNKVFGNSAGGDNNYGSSTGVVLEQLSSEIDEEEALQSIRRIFLNDDNSATLLGAGSVVRIENVY